MNIIEVNKNIQAGNAIVTRNSAEGCSLWDALIQLGFDITCENRASVKSWPGKLYFFLKVGQIQIFAREEYVRSIGVNRFIKYGADNRFWFDY